jgi:hypothetical protein
LRVPSIGWMALCCATACNHLEEMPPPYSSIPGKRQICPFPLTVELDGSLEDDAWQEAKLWQSVEHTMGPEETIAASDDDASFEFACVANMEYMYFAFRIRDDVINADGWSACDAYNSDSIELFVDQRYRYSREYDGDDSQIIIGPDNSGLPDSGERQIGGCILNAIPGAKTNTQVRTQRTEGGWQAEVAVPLRLSVSLGTGEMGWEIVPEHEHVIGFQTGYNDKDTGPDRNHRLVWGLDDRSTDHSYRDAGLLEELQFYAVDTTVD